MNDEDDYEAYCKYKAWVEQSNHLKSPIITVLPPEKKKRPEILVPIHYVWAAGAGALVLLIAAWPFTLLGFFIGLFVRIKFFGKEE